MTTPEDMPNMRSLIEGLGIQMREALQSEVLRPVANPPVFRGVVVLGMGGSGIGGAVMADMPTWPLNEGRGAPMRGW